MQFEDFKKAVAKAFPQEPKEANDAYDFYLSNAVDPFRGHTDLTDAWEQIKLYDGNTKRPKWSFFLAIAKGTKPSEYLGEEYYVCECGAKLSPDSDGGCPICHRSNGNWKLSHKSVQITPAKSPCFDCPLYSDTAVGPTCRDWGTPRRESCELRDTCKCGACCRFEYLRRYHPERLRGAALESMTRVLPRPISEAGKAFHDGRAGWEDINKMLKKLYKGVDDDKKSKAK